MSSTPGSSLPEIHQTGPRSGDDPDYMRGGDQDGMPGALQFIINNEPHLPNSRDQQRTVRSHVMRKSRAQRKERNNMPAQKRKILQKSGSEAVSPVGLAKDLVVVTTRETYQACPISTPTKPHQNIEKRPNPGSDSDCVTPESSYVASNEGASSRSVSIAPTSTPDSSTSESESPATTAIKFDRWVFDTSTPYILFQDEGAPSLCLSSRTWPFPKPIGAEKPKWSIFMPSRIIPTPNWKQPRGCMHKSALVIPHIINSREYYVFKIATIQWINERLDDVTIGVNDSTIGSILLLINFELMRGNVSESLHHMNGVQQIINVRGGLSNVNDRNVLTRLLIIDLLVAVLSISQPRFSEPSLLPPNLLGSSFYKIADSPLTTGRTLKIALLNSPFCDKAVKCLQRMQTLTMLAKSGINAGHLAEESEANLRLESLSLLDVIQHTSEIYARALQTPPIPFSARINRKSVQALCRAVESPAHDTTWDHCPGIFTWVLLVGCAAAEEESTEYNYFMCLLIKVTLGAGYGWLKVLREAVSNYVRVRARAEGKESDLIYERRLVNVR